MDKGRNLLDKKYDTRRCYLKILISNRSELPIYGQIKEQIKEQILSGQIPEGTTLPSIRQLKKWEEGI